MELIISGHNWLLTLVCFLILMIFLANSSCDVVIFCINTKSAVNLCNANHVLTYIQNSWNWSHIIYFNMCGKVYPDSASCGIHFTSFLTLEMTEDRRCRQGWTTKQETAQDFNLCLINLPHTWSYIIVPRGRTQSTGREVMRVTMGLAARLHRGMPWRLSHG